MCRYALMVRQIRFAVAYLLMLGALSACAGAAREPVDSLSELTGGETIIVGRIDLVPPLLKGEQKMSMRDLNSSSFENKILLFTDEHYRELTKEPELADYTGRIEAILEKNFFVRSSNKPFFIVGGVLYMELGTSRAGKIYFPGGLKVSIKPGDKAVYIGTVQYHRNEFFEVTKVSIVDDYEPTNAEFKKKFGNKISLHKTLLTKAN